MWLFSPSLSSFSSCILILKAGPYGFVYVYWVHRQPAISVVDNVMSLKTERTNFSSFTMQQPCNWTKENYIEPTIETWSYWNIVYFFHAITFTNAGGGLRLHMFYYNLHHICSINYGQWGPYLDSTIANPPSKQEKWTEKNRIKRGRRERKRGLRSKVYLSIIAIPIGYCIAPKEAGLWLLLPDSISIPTGRQRPFLSSRTPRTVSNLHR